MREYEEALMGRRPHRAFRRCSAPVFFLFCLLMAICPNAAADQNEAAPVPWCWEDGCFVLDEHPFTSSGTRAAFLLNAQGLASAADDSAQDSSAAFTFQIPVQQRLWTGASAVVFGEGGRENHVLPDELLGTNAAGFQSKSLFLSRAYLMQDSADARFQAAAGKITLTDFFDGNSVANCENNQFISDSLVNNPNIPFPDLGPGAAARYSPDDRLYLVAGIAEDDERVAIAEAGFLPALLGEDIYRVIVWHRSDSDEDPASSSGAALSIDLTFEERFAVFARFGRSDEYVNGMRTFWSLGGSWTSTGMMDGDALGLAAAQAADLEAAFGNAHQTLFEGYYLMPVTDFMNISPHIQVILNPVDSHRDTALVGILRWVLYF